MINDHEYWVEKFEDSSSDVAQRSAQTKYFTRLALKYLPQWCVESINTACKTLCDMGCAGGGGTAILQDSFPELKVIGVDFSETAIQKAKAEHGSVQYQTGDIRTFQEHYDILFSSNVLEHFYNSQKLLERLVEHSNHYLILLLPFREFFRISEHASTFDFRSFPLRIGDHLLSFFKIIPMCTDEDKRYWIGEQILVVYKHKDTPLPYGLTLENMYNGYMEERTKIIMDYDQKLSVQQKTLEAQSGTVSASEAELSEAKAQCKQLQNREKELEQQVSVWENQAKDLAEKIQQVEGALASCESKRSKLEAYTLELQSESDQYRKETEGQKKALKKAEVELALKRESLDSFQKLLAENQLVLLGVHEAISTVQHSRAYRVCLLLKRVKFQLLKCGWTGRKDLLRWIWGKLRGKIVGRPLQDFDQLVFPLQQLMWQSEQNNQSVQSLHSQSITGIIPKNSRQFFIFASVPFYDVGGGQRSAQLANALNSMGYEVYYIYGFDSSESKRETMYLPVIKHLHIDSYSLDEMICDVHADAVFIFEIPYSKFIPYLDYANQNEHTTIYEHIDNWDSSLGCMFYDKKDFQYFIDTAQHITITAKILGEKIEEAGRTDYLYSANAVDSSLFEPTRNYEKPADLVVGKRTLLYFGSLWGEWFDWEMLIHVAKTTDCAINLIGDYQPIADKIKSLPDNFHFLGIKKHEDLPAYLYYSDIALLPFKRSIIGKYVSPLKIFEYIAMNKPVLATPLDDIMGYPNVVLSEDPEEWAAAVRRGIDVADSTIFTAENSWYARCNQILDRVGRKHRNYPSISIIVLNHNNMKVILRCVSSLLTFSSTYECEVIVVDNASTDGSYERLQAEFGERIKLLKNQKNGCSSGRNLGARAATNELLLFLDSDQWVISEHYMDAALDLLLENEQVGAVAWNAGWFEKDTCTGPIVDYLPNRGIQAPWVLCRTDIAYLATSGFLMSRNLFDQIEGFDEFYDPTCFEDTDLSLKIRHAGYELAYCPYMNIMHLPHQTTQSGSSAHAKLMERNSKYFEDKWNALEPGLLNYHLDH